MHDRASVNSVAMSTLKIVYPTLLDVGCFSHTLDHVGEKFRTPTLSDFITLWINLFSHSSKSKLAWKDQTSVSNTHTEVQNAIGSSTSGCQETNECFIPYEVTVDVGGKVTWSNPDVAAHTVTSGVITDETKGTIFDSGLVAPGSTFSHEFEEAGTYPYFCFVHPWMEGVVIVQAVDDHDEDD